MLTELWPFFGLVIRTGDLELRLPTEHEIVAVAEVAGRGVHALGEQPFLTPWTAGSAEDRARFVLREHWRQLAGWSPVAWRLGLGVFRGEQALGHVTLRAIDYPVLREATSSSWLGLEHHGQGYGTAARVGLLALLFDHLDAQAALSEAFVDNVASQRVSRRLGYAPDGIVRDAYGIEVRTSDRLRLTRETWLAGTHPPVEVSGVRDCLPLLGLRG